MNNKNRIEQYDDDRFRQIASECESKVELHRRFNVTYNGKGCRIINSKILQTGAILKPKTLKWEVVSKECPVCHRIFTAQKGHPREKVVCSHGCSNTYFRSGEDNPNWKGGSYRSTCFHYHEKKCICCDEILIVAVHHYDGNKKNNDPINLMPLCPTHHLYWHSRYRYMIIDEVNKYRDDFCLKSNLDKRNKIK